MSDLQLSLLALGAVIVAGVILFNWWQERQFMQDSMKRFDAPVDDALMEEFSIGSEKADSAEEEAHFSIDNGLIEDPAEVERPLELDEPSEAERLPEKEPAEDMPQPPAGGEATEEDHYSEAEPLAPQVPAAHEAKPVMPAASEPVAARGSALLPAVIDSQVDLVASLHFGAPPAAATLYQSLLLLPSFDKLLQCYALDDAGLWHHLTEDHPDVNCSTLACALQLADRAGAASEQSLQQFVNSMQELASTHAATVEWSGSGNPAADAIALDQFCVEVDVMVGFHVTQGDSGPFAGTKLRGLAEAGGMTLHEDGAFHFLDESGNTLFTLISQEQRPFRPETLRTVFYRAISFQLDVPRVANCVETFNQMVLFARQMANRLDGSLVDDNQRALTENDIDKIAQQLRSIQSRMVAHGIMPGSITALRLFS